MAFERKAFASLLRARLAEKPTRIQIVAGPRQIGKTTLVRQVLGALPDTSHLFLAADHPTIPAENMWGAIASTALESARSADSKWLVEQWQRATDAMTRFQAQSTTASNAAPQPFVLVVDEIQKIAQWSETVKGLWDAARAQDAPIHLVLLGSSPLLMQKGLTESLAGRFEIIEMPHWSFEEMHQCFGVTLDEYIYFGGFPGSAAFMRDEARWRRYVLSGLIEPNIEKDILMMTRVDKPALLKQLFELGCAYSGQIVALSKIMGQLQDAGNTVTLTHYLELLSRAGLLTGLTKYAGQELRRRASPPKFHVLNTALMSACLPYTLAQAQADRSHWGRLVESTVGAHLCNTAGHDIRITYWRESPHEVDFIIERAGRIAAIEVKSGHVPAQHQGLAAFVEKFPRCKQWIVGDGGVPLGEFLRYPAEHWLE